MQSIVTVDSVHFRLNGIIYPKIFLPVITGSESLLLINAFDTRHILIGSTHFSDFQIDGSGYLDRPTLIDDLLPLTYSRSTSSGPGGGGGGSWGEIDGTLEDQTDLKAALDGKAATSHTHTIGNITGLQAALDGKAATSHTHTIGNITGLQAALDGKLSDSGTASNSDQLGGLNPGQFLRADVDDIKTAGNLVFNNDVRLQFGTTPNSDIRYNSSDGNLVVTLYSADVAPDFLWKRDGTEIARLTQAGGFQIAGNAKVGSGTNISPSTSPTGQLIIDGSGYDGYISLDGSAMHIGHNSGVRNLDFQTLGTTRMTINGSTGNITATGTITATKFFESSDRRLKSKIKKLKTRPIEADFVEYEKDGVKEVGVIAQDLEKTHPELVFENSETKIKSVSYRELFVHKIAALEETVSAQQNQIAQLLNMVSNG